jgi:hypothetical protein
LIHDVLHIIIFFGLICSYMRIRYKLMSEPKVKPLIPLIRRRLQIILPLLRRPTIPNLIPTLIPPDVVYFGQSIQN